MKALRLVICAFLLFLPTSVLVAEEPGGGSDPRTAGTNGPSIYRGDILDILRNDLQTGSPEQKKRALDTIMSLGAIRLLPEVMKAIEDPTPLPRNNDTGWGFVGHQAATTMSKIGQLIDGVDLKERGYHAYSFWDDSGNGGENLKAAGRLAEVRRNWEKWWEQRSNNHSRRGYSRN